MNKCTQNKVQVQTHRALQYRQYDSCKTMAGTEKQSVKVLTLEV